MNRRRVRISLPKFPDGGKYNWGPKSKAERKKLYNYDADQEAPDMILTLKDDKSFIDNISNWAAVSGLDTINPAFNDQIKKRLYSGKWGYNPKTGYLVNLEKAKAKDRTTTLPESEKKFQKERQDIPYEQAIKDWNKDRVRVQIPDSDAWSPNFEFEGLGKTMNANEMRGQTVHMTQQEADNYLQAQLQSSIDATYRNPIMYAPGMIYTAGAAPALDLLIGAGSSIEPLSRGEYGEAALTFGLGALPMVPGGVKKVRSGFGVSSVMGDLNKVDVMADMSKVESSIPTSKGWIKRGSMSGSQYSELAQQKAFDQSFDFTESWVFKDTDKLKEYKEGIKDISKRTDEVHTSGLDEANSVERDEVFREILKEYQGKPDSWKFENPDLLSFWKNHKKHIEFIDKTPTYKKYLDDLKAIDKRRAELNDLIVDAADDKFIERINNIRDMEGLKPLKKGDVDLIDGLNQYANIRDRSRLVAQDINSPSFKALSPENQQYLLTENVRGFRGDDVTVTLSGKTERWDSELPKSFIEKINPFAKPRYEQNIFQERYSPTQILGTSSHETAHDVQHLFGFGKVTSKYSPEFGYYTSNPDTRVGRFFEEVMVEPKAPKGSSYDYQTWKSSPNELHSEVWKERARVYKTMRDIGIPHEEAMTRVRSKELEFLMESPEINKHFRLDAPTDAKRTILRDLTPVAIPGAFGVGIGFGGNQSEQKYGGLFGAH
jgi:hypothetical protein